MAVERARGYDLQRRYEGPIDHPLSPGSVYVAEGLDNPCGSVRVIA